MLNRIGDRFFDLSICNIFTLLEFFDQVGNLTVYRGKWYNGNTDYFYSDELDSLEFMGNRIIKVKDDKHLLELRLKYAI